jgi:hypothetical protein
VPIFAFSSGRPLHIRLETHIDRPTPVPQDALSNSNGCLPTIPKCESGACATRNVMGTARWVCLRCMANYQPVVTSDGQDNIVQCGEFTL